MPKIDIAGLPVDARTNYPAPLGRVVDGRERTRLGGAHYTHKNGESYR